jgi:hypothetical protein
MAARHKDRSRNCDIPHVLNLCDAAGLSDVLEMLLLALAMLLAHPHDTSANDTTSMVSRTQSLARWSKYKYCAEICHLDQEPKRNIPISFSRPSYQPLQNSIQIRLLLGTNPVTTNFPTRHAFQIQRLDQLIHRHLRP